MRLKYEAVDVFNLKSERERARKRDWVWVYMRRDLVVMLYFERTNLRLIDIQQF